ncbi:hypothetical protein ABN763_13185 [Spongiivirga sp. MCCC 1A20706]|uniref:hypothetical protein n=1 Tax=Spongiivirga sp. MCCC 1A20706 TaxID=3160963 RepID=UPI0039775CFA
MITSIILRTALLANSIAIILHLLTNWLDGISLFMLLAFQFVIISGYFINKIVTQVVASIDRELNDVDIIIRKKQALS